MAKSEKIDWSVFARGAAGRGMRLIGVKRMLRSLSPWLVFTVAIAGISFKLSLSRHAQTYLPWMIALFLLWYIWRLKIDVIANQIERTWLKGARGEQRVAKSIQQIESENFMVIHDLPNGGGNIDHVVVGRTGVFVIETKSHEGRIHYANNHLHLSGKPFPNRDPLKQVRGQAAWIADKLKPITGARIYVKPILCFVNAWVENEALTVERVSVTRPQFLSKMVTGGTVKFSPKEVAKMAAALRPGD